MPVIVPNPPASSGVNTYTTLEVLKDYLGITTTNHDGKLTQVLNSASRAIDNYCHSRFWLDDALSPRTFDPGGAIEFQLSNDGIGDLTGLIVETDPAGAGTFSTLWSATDYQLLPLSAPYGYPEPQPWTAIRAVGPHIFPYWTTGWTMGRMDRVRITARWGWPAIPDAVVSACLIKATSLFHRKDSPQGIAGFGDFGPVRLTPREDSDVTKLLDPYRFLVSA